LGTSAAHASSSTKLSTVKLAAAARTDVGRRRSENQDSYGYIHTARASLFVVADGMGGARGGGTASAMAVNIIVEGSLDKNGELTLESLHDAISLSNKVIFSRSRNDAQLTGMGTTVVALAFIDDTAIVGHVGDSRIYLWRGDSLLQLTRDHTLVQELVDTGAIMQQDAANHPIAHMLTRSLGPTELIGVEIHPLPDRVQPGDRFLLCSDGLYNHVSHDEIAEVLGSQPIEAASDELIKRALDGGGSDNVTLQIVEVLSLNDDRIAAERPVEGKVEKLISSEIDVHEFDGVTLSDFTRSFDTGARPSGPSDDGQPTANGSHSAASQSSIQEESTHADPTETGGPSVSTPPPQARPMHYAVLAAAGICASVLAYWILFKPLPTPVPLSESNTSAGTDELTKEMIEWQPSGSADSASSPQASTESSSLAASSSSESSLSVTASSAAQSSSAAEINSSSSFSEGAVSSAAPESASASSESRLALNIPGESDLINAPINPETAPTAPITLTDSEIMSEHGKKYAELLASASDLSVTAAPRVSLGGGKTRPAVEPIVWEKENRALEEMKSSSSASSVSSTAPKLLTQDEILVYCDKKAQLRSKIADLDAKLEMLVLETKEQAKTKQTRLEMESAHLSEALEGLTDDLHQNDVALTNWEKLQKESAEMEMLKLADEVALMSDEVKEKRAKYSEATEKYLTAVDQWQNAPKDDSEVATMAALNRDVKARRVELEVSISAAINRGFAVAQARQKLLQHDIAVLKDRQALLNRHIGLLRAYTPEKIERRREAQTKLLTERAAQMAELTKLRAAFSDEDENAFRRKNPELFLTSPTT